MFQSVDFDKIMKGICTDLQYRQLESSAIYNRKNLICMHMQEQLNNAKTYEQPLSVSVFSTEGNQHKKQNFPKRSDSGSHFFIFINYDRLQIIRCMNEIHTFGPESEQLNSRGKKCGQWRLNPMFLHSMRLIDDEKLNLFQKNID